MITRGTFMIRLRGLLKLGSNQSSQAIRSLGEVLEKCFESEIHVLVSTRQNIPCY